MTYIIEFLRFSSKDDVGHDLVYLFEKKSKYNFSPQYHLCDFAVFDGLPCALPNMSAVIYKYRI